MKKGSILILALVTIMILSIMAIAGLSVTNIEIQTSGNYQRGKQALYKAIDIVETIRMRIENNPDPSFVTSIKENSKNSSKKYITGTLVDFENGTSKNVMRFETFNPPPFKGMSLDDRISVSPVIWYVPVTTMIEEGKYKAYSEIQSGVYSILNTGY
jgi:hypothetical protein